MRVDSAKYTEAHFDAKADRYQAALRSAPRARNLELLPFLLILGDYIENGVTDLTVADLLCGSGFLTSAIRGCFRQIFGVDVSQNMLSYYPVGPGLRRIKISLDDQSDTLTGELRPDVILALAGLHHVYEIVDGRVCPEQSDDLQRSVVTGWAESLPADGVMIIADITSPHLPPSSPIDDRNIRKLCPALTQRYAELSGALEKHLPIFSGGAREFPRSISEYATAILEKAPCAANAQPGLWFRNVVASLGLYGHVDHFLNAPSLVSALEKRGFDVKFYELPTPWVFPSADAFIFFFYEKFALGQPVDAFDEIPDWARDLIKEKAEEYLGLNLLADGAVAVGWRLGYYVVRRHR